MSIYKILQEIKNTPSTNDKIKILESHKNNTLLRDCLKLMLDSTCFYVNKIPNYDLTHILPKLNISLEDNIQPLSCLSDRKYTGNSAIKFLEEMLYHSNEDDAEVIKLIIKKDPDCGIAAKTVNKVWKELIKEIPYMRCETDNSNLILPCIAELKSDGMFFNCICNNGSVSFLSRNGKFIDLLGIVEKEFDSLKNNNIVLHGELLVLDDNGNIMKRSQGNGLLQKSIKGTMTPNIANRVIVNLWDVLPYEDWINGYCDTQMIDRFAYVNDIVNKLSDKISLTPYKYCENIKDCSDFYNEQVAKGLEGSIEKNLNGVWKNGTSKDNIKHKEEKDCDLICYSSIPHKKKENQIGSLCCMSSDGIVKVNVSGLSDNDRKKDPSFYLDKIMTVKYNELICNVKGEWSLYLPRIVEIDRVDINTADSFNKIKGL